MRFPSALLDITSHAVLGCTWGWTIIPPVLHDPPLTKRQLGLLIIAGGVALAAVTLAVNLFGLGHFNGFGPAKQLALVGAAAIIVFGLSLVPLGDRPA
jgi:hypothetical protein